MGLYRLAGSFLLLAWLPWLSHAQTHWWPAAGIAGQNIPELRLVDAEGKPHVTVSPELVQQLVAVQDRLQRVSNFRGELFITNGQHPNAFAVESKGRSIIGITAPMLELLGDDLDAYAALMGHEIGHHVRQHGEERRSREKSLGVGSIFAGILLGAAGVRGGGQIAELGRVLVSRSYSREEEREADRLGVEWMLASGFDPRGALRLHERLQTRAGDSVSFLQTHPSSEERIDNIRQQIAALGTSEGKAAEEIRVWVARNRPQVREMSLDNEVREAHARGAKAFRSKDFTAAHREWIVSANGGHPDSQFGLGALHFQGWGVDKDPAVAVDWFRKAANGGHDRAQNSLGHMYEQGTGVERDLAVAAEWFRKSASQGNVNAQFNLGRLYFAGRGVQADRYTAYIWFSLAAQRGHTGAASERALVVGGLSAEDLARANDVVRAWKPESVVGAAGASKPESSTAGERQPEKPAASGETTAEAER